MTTLLPFLPALVVVVSVPAAAATPPAAAGTPFQNDAAGVAVSGPADVGQAHPDHPGDAPVAAGATAIEVFTTGAFPITGVPAAGGDGGDGGTVVVHHLDRLERITEALSRDLPADPEAAAAAAEARFRGAADGLKAEVQAAAAALERAVRLGLDRVPAIVFADGQVVYGVTDLGQAKAIRAEAIRAQTIRPGAASPPGAGP